MSFWAFFWFFVVLILVVGAWVLWKGGAWDGTKAKAALESAKEKVETTLDDLTHKK